MKKPKGGEEKTSSKNDSTLVASILLGSAILITGTYFGIEHYLKKTATRHHDLTA